MQEQLARTLRCYYNWFSREGLPIPESGWPAAIREAGYDGVQFVDPLDLDALAQCRECGLGVCGSGRINRPEDAFHLAEAAQHHNLEALTLHVGWGLEDDHEAATLIEAVLAASAEHKMPLYVETHRATIFQDLWRTVQFVHRFPELKFNGDFSHWYTGLEMVYGDFEKKLEFIRPVMDRVCFMHGRIGNPGCMQVDIGDLESAMDLTFVQHFRRLWWEVFRSYHRRPDAEPVFCFAVELLASDIYYAREFKGHEESNRWQQSLVVREIARQCFREALSSDVIS